MSEHTGTPCRNCGETIYWHKSRSGKNYPTNSSDNRRDFHECPGRPSRSGTTNTITPAKAATERRAGLAQLSQILENSTRTCAAKVQLEATTEDRVAALEQQVSQLNRMFSELRQEMPIIDSDVGF